LTEAEVRRVMEKKLRAKGWMVIAFSWNRRMPATLKDFPDLLCFHQDKVLLIEAKAPGKKRTPGQLEFYEAIKFLLGKHLAYCCADKWEDVAEAMADAGW